MPDALLLGGPFNGRTITITKTPPRISIAGRIYEQITDPDTGDGLGAYVAIGAGAVTS